MEDLAFYNPGCKAVSLLITILANVVIFRLLTRDALGLGSTHTHANTHTHVHTHTPTHAHMHTHPVEPSRNGRAVVKWASQ